MKLLVTILLVALLASSTSGIFFKKKKAKVLDIHISKGFQEPVGQPVPVGQFPVEQFGWNGYPYTYGVPVAFDQVVPSSPSFVALNQFEQGPIRGHQVILGATKGGHHGIKTPVGQPVPIVAHSFEGQQSTGGISVPVISRHSLQVVPVQVPAPLIGQPQLVSVEPTVQAVQLLFKTASSPLQVQQKHFGGQGSILQATRSYDNTQYLRHEVVKPVHQEVREIIQPFRQVTQEVRPVQEHVQTILPRGQYQEPPVYQGEPFPVSYPVAPAQQRVHFGPQDYQKPIVQEPIEQEPIEQAPIKGHH